MGAIPEMRVAEEHEGVITCFVVAGPRVDVTACSLIGISFLRAQPIWTEMIAAQARDFQRTFKDNPEMAISDSCPTSSLALTGDSASWTRTETILANAEAQLHSHATHIVLAKKNCAWIIADRR